MAKQNEEKSGVTFEVVTLEQLQAKYPNLCAQLATAAVDAATIEITDVTEMAERHPQLCEELTKQVKETLASELAQTEPGDFAKICPSLYDRIVKHVTAAVKANAQPIDLKTQGFYLDPEDPFAAGTARMYGKLKGVPARLPMVLPFKDKNAAAAIENYIVRAAGGGDTKRAESAKAALKKVKS